MKPQQLHLKPLKMQPLFSATVQNRTTQNPAAPLQGQTIVCNSGHLGKVE